jgi:hypothetical protein
VSHRLATLLLAICIPGCALMGPRDDLVVVSGTAPTVGSGKCLASVALSNSLRAAQEIPVAGSFREGFVVNPGRHSYVARLTCGGSVVAERTFRFGKDVKSGGEVPLDGTAP